MQLKVYSVYDSAVAAYGHPMNFVNRGAALRWFTDELANPQSMFARHPKDFTLFELGEYDDQNGVFTNNETKISVGTALELQSRDRDGVIPSGVTQLQQPTERKITERR